MVALTWKCTKDKLYRSMSKHCILYFLRVQVNMGKLRGDFRSGASYYEFGFFSRKEKREMYEYRS